MLHAIQLEREKYAGLSRENRTASAEDRKAMLRSCQQIVQLPDDKVRLVSEHGCPEPAFREITNAGERIQKLKAVVLADPVEKKGFPERSETVFIIQVYERLDKKAEGVDQRYTPIILSADKKQIIRHFFVRCPPTRDAEGKVVSEDHVALRFARRAIAHWMLTGAWPAKQGTTIGEQ